MKASPPETATARAARVPARAGRSCRLSAPRREAQEVSVGVAQVRLVVVSSAAGRQVACRSVVYGVCC